MAARYYDDAIIYKINRWLPTNSGIRILRPEDTKHFFATKADDRDDRAFTLPMLSLYRNKDIKLRSNIKQSRSFNGLKLVGDQSKTLHLNIIPIELNYQLDIYTKTFEEGDEYLRSLLFKLINNPVICITIPYQGSEIQHIANIRVLDTVSDTSTSGERLFAGQFTRWTIQLEIQDAFLFSVPYRNNWKIVEPEIDIVDNIYNPVVEERIPVPFGTK